MRVSVGNTGQEFKECKASPQTPTYCFPLTLLAALAVISMADKIPT